jgi:inner membrane protein
MNFQTLGLGVLASLLGGLAPDLDQVGSGLWRKLPGGWFVDNIFNFVLIGGHRAISHSLIGIFLAHHIFGFILTPLVSPYNLNGDLIQWAFTIAYTTHLVMDSLTVEGVPWLWPVPIKWGVPPLKAFRIVTGSKTEKLLVEPVLLAALVFIYYKFAATAFSILKNLS